MRRPLNRVAVPLVLGLALGALVALLLGRVLDQAVRERSRRDLAAALERLEGELGPGLASGADVSGPVRLAARQLGVRVTLIAADGHVVADSQVDPERLPKIENHAGRPEVVAARRDGVGFAERRSATVVEPFVYVARRVGPAEVPLGFVRLAIRESELAALEAPFRKTLLQISLGAGILVALLVLAIRHRHAAELDRVRDGVVAASDGRGPAPFPGASEETQEVFLALTRFARLVALEREGSEKARLLARTVFEEVPAGLVVVDGALDVLDANPAARRLFGAPPRTPLRALVDLVRTPAAVALFRKGVARDATETPCAEVVRIDAGGGRERVLEVTVRSLPHGGQPGEPAAVGVIRDETERERMENMRRRFVADVSHELRTPIAAIRAAAETIAPEEGLPPDLVRLVDIVQRQAADMEDLVSDLTDLSQIEAGTVTLQIDRIDLAPLLSDVVQSLTPAAVSRAVAVAVAAPKGLHVRGDRRRLAQIFRNLVDNAIKFSPPGARVDVLAEGDGERVAVHVVDRGIGIPKGEQANIFQRFYRVDPSRTKATPGTGLGLAIVKHLLILHGGLIRVESEPGNGSRFTVTLLVHVLETATKETA